MERLDKINRVNEPKMKKGVIKTDYMKLKKQLNKYKNRAGEFNKQGKSLRCNLSS